MFVQHVALAPMPPHAHVTETTIAAILKRMAGDAAVLQRELDEGFRRMELRQPDLAAFLASELSRVSQPSVQTISYFLFVVIHEAFCEAFGARVGALTDNDLRHLARRMIADGELRSSGQLGDSYSEDLVAVGQPGLVQLIRAEIDKVVDELGDPPGWSHAEPVYEAALLEIVALSHAVAPG